MLGIPAADSFDRLKKARGYEMPELILQKEMG
jgi:hypothetical protein